MKGKRKSHGGLFLKSDPLFFIFFLSAALLFFPAQSPAAETTLTPSIGIMGEYNDNIDFSHGNERDDFLSTISPGIALDYKTERTALGAMARFDVRNYLDYTEENTVNQNYSLNASHKLYEKLSVRANGRYTRDETTDTYLQETGLVTEKSKVHRYGAGAGLSYNLNEVSDVDLDYAYSKADYDREDKVDTATDSVTLAYRYAFFDRRDIVTVSPRYYRYDSDESTTDSYGVSLGLAHRLRETLVINAALGVRYSDTEYHRRDTTDDYWDWTADISATQTWETASASIGYGRNLYYNDEGNPVTVNRFYARANKNFTDRFGVSLNGILYFTKSEGDFDNEDARYYEITPSLYYNITLDHRLEVGYSYANDYDKTLEDNQKAERNRVWVLLTFNFPRTW